MYETVTLTFLVRYDLDLVMKNNVPDVKDLLKGLQMTIEFETQLTKRYEKHVSPLYDQNVNIF